MRSFLAGFVLILWIACSSKPEAEPPSTSTSEGARDSAIAGSALPGARGVRGAMQAADSAAARNARIDSMAP